MNNFSELLAIDFTIDIIMVVQPKSATSTVNIVINDLCIYDGMIHQSTAFNHSVSLLAPIKILVLHDNAYVKSLKFDTWESRPEYGTEGSGIWSFETHMPFYHWQHQVTGLGWLLTPH
jgi:hypothetical protein